MNIKIVIAENNLIYLDGLRFLIGRQSDMELIGEANDGKTILNIAQQVLPDIVIVDVNMNDLHCFNKIHQITATLLNTKVIALVEHPDKHFLMEIFKAGASGCLLKKCSCEDIVHGIRKVSNNIIYMDDDTVGLAFNYLANETSGSNTSVVSLLTESERKVLYLIIDGKSKKQIASILNINTGTVELYQSHALTLMLNINSLRNQRLTYSREHSAR